MLQHWHAQMRDSLSARQRRFFGVVEVQNAGLRPEPRGRVTGPTTYVGGSGPTAPGMIVFGFGIWVIWVIRVNR
jgi:hypothetical protein